MRLPNSAHTWRPWRIHEIASDFRVEDVWALPTPGGPGDFPAVVQLFTSMDASLNGSPVVRNLMQLRWKIGALLGWDSAGAGVHARVGTLKDRLPADLRNGSTEPNFEALPFTPLYFTDDEFAAEMANRTMHGILHLGWVQDGDAYRGQLAVLVKPNGLFGAAYMASILPLRRLLVYPAGMRRIERVWQAGVESKAGR